MTADEIDSTNLSFSVGSTIERASHAAATTFWMFNLFKYILFEDNHETQTRFAN